MAIYSAKTSIAYAKRGVRVNSYMKNLAKSAGYIGMDIFKSYAPTMTSLASSTKEAASTGYQAIRDFTSSSNDSDFSFKGIKNKSGEVINNMWKNTVEDLKSGKIYNKERSDALGDEIASGFLGDDFNFDFNFDDDDWGDDDSSSSEESTAKAVIEGEVESTKAIISAVDAMGQGVSASVTNATVESASYIAASARENSLALFNLNKEGFGAITQALMSVNETIYGFSKIGAPLTAHMQNSSLFYTKTGESLNNIEQTLRQIEQNTKPAPIAGSKGYKTKRSLGSMMSDEGINWYELAESMKETVNEYKDLTSMFVDMFKPTAKSGGKNISILGMGATAIAKKIMPKVIEDTIKGLDESIKYGLGAGLTKISKTSTGNFLVDTLLDMFLPKRDLKSSISTSNYEKGAVQWDGVARKALTDVIPTTLLQIYSVLSGTDPMRFDYEKGKFVKAQSIAESFKNRKSKYVKESGGDFYTEVEKAIKSSRKSDKDQAKMLADAYKFFEYAFDNTDHNIKNSSGIDPATFAMIQEVAANMKDKKFKNKWVVEANKKAADWSNSNRSEETSGFSMMQILHDEFSGEGGKGKKGTKTTIIGLDEYGHNYYFYLQGIWQYVGYMANNWGGKGKGKKGKGAPSLNSNTLPQIQSVDFSSGEQTTQEVNESLGLSGTSEEEENAKDVKENTNKIKKWVKENVSDKMRNKINKIFGTEISESQFGAIGIINSVSNAIDNLIWGGDEDNPEKGLFSYLFEKTKDMFDNFKDYFKKNVIDKFKDWFDRNVGEKWEQSQWVQGTKETLGKVGRSIKGSVRKVFIGDDGYNGTAAYGRKVTKTGTVTVSEGELIIPSELNPYYHGATNKASQINNERRISGGRYPMYAEGGIAGEYGFTMRDATASEDFSARHGIGTNSILGVLIHAASGAFAKTKKVLDDSVDEKKLEEDEKKLSNGIGKALQEVGGSKGEIGAGAVLGVGASILTGAILGPIAGAALGAGIGLISKSKAVQDLLFGEEEIDDDGVKKRKHQKMYDFFMKELPGIGKGAAIGAGAGLFLGSPLLGAFIGAAGGFMTSSERFKKWLFGDESEEDNGAIPNEVQEYVKKKLPAVTAGAILGAVAGPFGLVGNILLGSSLGIAATSGRLHDSIFGGDGVEKEESLVFVVKEKIFGGIDNIFHNMNNRFKVWSKELAKSINDKLSKAIDDLKENAKAGKGGFLTKALGGAINGADWLIDKTVKAPFKLVGGLTSFIDNRIATGNLKGGYSTYNRKAKRNMTADERLDARVRRNVKLLDKNFGKFDSFLDSLETFDELNMYKRIFDTIKTEPEGSEDYIKAVEFLTKDKKFSKFMNLEDDKSLEKFIKKNAIKITSLISDEANREDAAGNKVFTAENQAKLREEKKVNLIQTITDYLKTVTTYGVKINLKAMQDENKGPGALNTPLLPPPKDESKLPAKYTSGGLSGEPLKLTVNNQGEEVVDNRDKDNKNIMAKNNAAMAGLASLSTLGDKLGGIFSGLFGKKDDKKEKKTSFLDKIKSWLGEKFVLAKSFLSTKLSGILTTLGTFVPAIGTVTTAIGQFFNVTTVSGFLKTLAKDAAVFLALKSMLFGPEDSVFNKLINKLAEKLGLGGSGSENSEETNGKPNDNGGQKHDFQLSDGTSLISNGDGTYSDANGNIYDSSQVNTVIAGKDTFLGNLRKSTLARVVTGRKTLVGTIAGKTTWGKKIGGAAKNLWNNSIAQGAFDQGASYADDFVSGMKSGNLIGKSDDLYSGIRSAASSSGNADEYARGFKATFDKLTGKSAKAAAKEATEDVVDKFGNTIVDNIGSATVSESDDVIKGALQTNIDDFLEKMAKWTPKLPFVGEKLANSAPTMFKELSEKIAKGLGKVATKAANVLSTALPILLIGLIIKDFITGWEDARTVMGITKTPTTAQRAVCGLLRAVKNNIPYIGIIGSLIPDSFLINLFAKYVGPALGVDTSQILKDQDEAQQQVEAYNAEHGTSYSVAEYNKAVLHDYTFTERIGNSIKTTVQQTKDNWKAIKGSYEEAGGGFQGISAGVKTAFEKGLPGIIGEIAKKNLLIKKYALDGNIEGIWETHLDSFYNGGETNEDGIETAVPSLFSKMIGELPIMVTKFMSTPFALVSKVGHVIWDRIKDFLDIDGIKEIDSGMDNLIGISNALQAITDGDLTSLWSYNSAKEDDNGFIGFLKLLPTVPLKVVSTIPALFSKAGHAIWDGIISPIIDKVKNTVGNFKKGFTEAFNAAYNDKWGLQDVTEASDEEGNPLSAFQKVVLGVGRISGGVFSLFVKAGEAIAEKFKAIFTKVKNSVVTFGQTSAQIAMNAITGHPQDMWQQNLVEADPENPVGNFTNAAIFIEKLTFTPISGITWLGRQIGEKVSEIIQKVKGTIEIASNRASVLSQYITNGDPEGLANNEFQDEEGNPISGVLKGIDTGLKLVMIPIAHVTKVGNAIKNKVDEIKETISKSITKIAENQIKLQGFVDSGDPEGLWRSSTDFEDSPISGIGTGITIGLKLVNTLPATVKWVGNGIKSAFDAFVGPIKDDVSSVKTYYTTLMNSAEKGNVKDIVSTKFTTSSPFGGIFTFASSVIRLAAIFKAGSNWMGKKIKNAAIDAKEALSGSWFGKLLGFDSNDTNTSNSKKKGSGSGSGLAVGQNGGNNNYSTGFQSQLDPRYKDISFANSTIGDAGCAPAVGTMVSATMGGSMDMNSAIDKARAYTNSNGTSAKYFEDTFNASPLKSTNTVKSALESGRPVILLGRDPSNNNKNKSPFGPDNHYVLAMGMKNGKVVVNDPESNGPRVYDQSILNKSSYNLTYGGSSRRGKGFSDTENAQQIWAYLTGKLGFTEAGAAGLMGCWQNESSNNPNTIEGYYLSGYPGDDAVHTSEGLDNFTTNVLFPAYASSGISINKEAYKGSDGHYYPGFGLAQWTGPRGKALHDYESTSGKAWYTLDNQMQFVGNELQGSYSNYLSKAKSATDVNQATTDAYYDFEGGTRSDWLVQRKADAADIYSTYTGKTYNYNGGGDAAGTTSNSSDSSSSDSSSSDGSILSTLSSIFGSLSSIFDLTNGFSLNGSSNSSSNSSSGVTNAKGAAAAAQAAENQLGYQESGDNITTFGDWSGCNGQPWCGAFSAWSIAQAFDGQNSSAKKALYNCDNVNYCPTLVSTFKNNNAWYDEPEVGDEVLYSKNGDDAYHVGLVTSVDKNAKTFVSVEGNTNDAVTKKEHSSYKDGNVYGFGRPDYTGATATIASNGNNNGNTISGDADYSATGSGIRGGSSGILRKAAPSRFAYGSLKGQRFRFGGSSGLISKNRFSGAGSNLTKTVTKTLTNLKKNLTGGLNNNGYNNNGTIDAELVEELLVSITSLLNSINSNTAPTQQIYDALKEYIDYVKGNKTSTSTNQVSMPTNNNEVDTNFANLVTTLAAIARG